MLNNNNNELNFEFEGEETMNVSQDDNIYPLKEISTNLAFKFEISSKNASLATFFLL